MCVCVCVCVCLEVRCVCVCVCVFGGQMCVCVCHKALGLGILQAVTFNTVLHVAVTPEHNITFTAIL